MPPLFWKIILGVALGVVVIRGGGPALIRLLLPVLLVYFGYKAVQRIAAAKLADLSERMREAQRRGPGGQYGEGSQPTIEICPNCGYQKSPQNMCTCS